ncbi:unnamed protein product (mitochondrion) [Plasmodiophora brassicae]|uniref:Uncharacterized protein n=1 Tax=Plasmodiophora brassicae TaxID=37360 RepID=A0A3P3YBF3_PLABS|nr:unnamed protein product [Plasmodiophora brassicae]
MGDTSGDIANRCQLRMYLGVDLDEQAPHGAAVQSMAIVADDADVVFTGSRDATIKQWVVTETYDDDGRAVGRAFQCDATYRAHTDWVTGLVAVGDRLLSASCDRSVRVWERASGRCLTTARFHADYVESIGVARDANVAVSAGLDNQLYLWDLQDMRAPTRAFTDDGAGEHCTSFYAVDVDPGARAIVSGSSDKFVRVWDPRMGRLVMRLPGHTLNVRDVRLNASATAAVSGSSDHTVRRWDLGQQRCVDMHTPLVQDAVWTLAVDDTWSRVYAAGRSQHVACINLDRRQTSLVATAADGVHVNCLRLDGTGQGLFLATNDAIVTCLDVSALEGRPDRLPAGFLRDEPSGRHDNNTNGDDDDGGVVACPPCRRTTRDVAGRAPVVAAHALNDGRRVLARDRVGVITLWNVVEQRRVSTFPKGTQISDLVARLDADVSLPSWFTIDLHLGALGIVLSRSAAFAAEAWVEPNEQTEADQVRYGLVKVNLGAMALRNALARSPAGPQAPGPDDDVGADGIRVSRSPHPPRQRPRWFGWDSAAPNDDDLSDLLPGPDPHQPLQSPKRHADGDDAGPDLPCLIVSQQVVHGNAALFRVLNLYDRDQYDAILPPWVRAWVVDGSLPAVRPSETRFDIGPDPSDALPDLPDGSAMKAEDSLTMRRLAAYLVTRLAGVVDDPSLDAYVGGGADPDHPERVVEILCEGRVLPATMSLRTARTFAWTSKRGPFTLTYRRARHDEAGGAGPAGS